MSDGPIYEPKGRAREYSPLALNIFGGCSHGCEYCYVPAVLHVTKEQYHGSNRLLKSFSLQKLDLQAEALAGDPRQILLSFVGDLYSVTGPLAIGLRKTVLGFLDKYKLNVAILTKGGLRCLSDLNYFRAFGDRIKVGQSLTLIREGESKRWEPGAADPFERIEALRVLHRVGVRTWASMEPVIDPGQSMRLIRESLPYVDEYRLGKLNHVKQEARDWEAYLSGALELLRAEGKDVYVKRDLREAAPGVPLTAEEVDADRSTIRKGG
ncbi:MAG: radical SAM protein [bacterium]